MTILFICRSNINRSQMAEAFARSLEPKIIAKSAAADISSEWDGKLVSSISDNSINAMHEVGINMNNAVIKQVDQSMIDEADVVISMATLDELPQYVATSPKLRMWDVLDPGEHPYDTHIKVRDIIAKNVKEFLSHKTTSVFVIVINKNGQILLQHRSEDAPTNPNKWQLWGGAIEGDEIIIDTAIRELREELSLEIAPDELKLFYIQDQDEINQSAIYLLHIDKNTTLSLGEGDGYGTFDEEAILTLDLETTTKSALSKYLKYNI